MYLNSFETFHFVAPIKKLFFVFRQFTALHTHTHPLQYISKYIMCIYVYNIFTYVFLCLSICFLSIDFCCLSSLSFYQFLLLQTNKFFVYVYIFSIYIIYACILFDLEIIFYLLSYLIY